MLTITVNPLLQLNCRLDLHMRNARGHSSPGSAVARQRLVGRLVQRFLILGQSRIVARLRHAEAFGQTAVEQAGALEFIEARQIGDLLQPEMEPGTFRSCRK